MRKAALFEGAHPSRSSLVEPPLGTSASLALAFPLKHASSETTLLAGAFFIHRQADDLAGCRRATSTTPALSVFFCMLVRKPKLLNESAGSNDEST